MANSVANPKPGKAEVDILLVDDNVDALVVMTEYFNRHGYSVATAKGAEEALRVTDRNTLSLMVIDINLAGENGAQLMSFLKVNHPGVPAILYTGSQLDPEQIDACQRAGADRCVFKCESLAVLLSAIRDLCPRPYAT